jgi:hypothetical protein
MFSICGREPPHPGRAAEPVHPPNNFGGIADAGDQRPALSLVLTGRNDGYGGDFLARFFRSFRFNHQQMVLRGIAHELVFVEWAPPHGAALIRDRIFDAIPELDPSVCSWYVVDPRYQEELSLNPRLEYLEFPAKNVGVRRARGRFVLTSNCDVCFGRQIFDALAGNTLEPRVLYRAPRHDLTLPAERPPLDWSVLEDPRNLAGPAHVLKPPYMGSATGDFVLLDRDSFHEIGGFNEVYRVARIGVDRNILVKALSSGLRIADIGGPVYHENHEGSYRLNPTAYAGRETEAPWGDRRWHSGGVSYVNPSTWGLSDAPVRAIGDRTWYLDFSWEAVPPLVDLQRIVLPVARAGSPLPGHYVRKR